MGSAAVIDLRDDQSCPELDAAAVGFQVQLDEFSGPFDVLLGLIAKHALEVTELALHQVTDEYCAYIREQGSSWDLDDASAFVVVAATLLDLKAARLLPSGQVDDEEDLALLEARDLLFARLLQYRAYKEVSGIFVRMMEQNAGVRPRVAGMDPQFLGLLPPPQISSSLARFAELAAAAFAPPPPPPVVGIGHLHDSAVSVAEQVAVLAVRMQREGASTFRALTSDAPNVAVIVARFLGLLELRRRGAVVLEQVAALGDLHVRWVAESFDPDQLSWDNEFDADTPVEPASPPPRENEDGK